MDLQLTDHVVLVVGGTGLIGRAVARTLAEEGAVVVTAARGEGADLRLDAADDASVEAAVAQVLERHGRIDGLVVAAAPPAQTLDPARASDPAQVAQAVDGKAMTFLRIANAVLPHMRAAGSGRVVGVSGQNALITGNITGAVRNAALIIAAQSLADELAGTGVAVNVVNPGPVTDDARAEVALGKPGESTPQQVADLVVMLLSPRIAVSSESIASGHRVRGAVAL
ncbi:SDR family NAD(P)-dependent oxidoreductase [Agrococcus carbonis]|uniref:NADP-dependent 3-hydroxy acid dehydrogenase YdfG n=1 Tax=Agrococcus carbonis TaxID=684552 RepID=A0A1H1L080_9MICO|nr:SDR family oxidoreductase [Agrococcus carbonis]SDR67339.1 NADP-dependent 3-hydroxy acid dehydrogenase YdfG [Agrococcus carbonis]